jgi:hypothetical protein
MKTEADDDDGAVSVDFFFPGRFCFIPAGSVRFFPGFRKKKSWSLQSKFGSEREISIDADSGPLG